jgi:tetratricopeptide (TPR) repeat protein
MILPLLLLLQVTGPVEAPDARFERCADLASAEPDRALAEASAWRLAGGTVLARRCEGLAYAGRAQFAAAAGAFEQAARAAELAHDPLLPELRAQAGNAWLAAGDPVKAKAALDAALAAGGLSGLALGEAHLDRARALVATGDLGRARPDLDRALVDAKDDPLAWLLSATLARRTGDLARAKADLAQALARASDDASVQLEAGNIAALDRDEAGARGGWNRAAQLGGASAVGAAARAALAQFTSNTPDAGK